MARLPKHFRRRGKSIYCIKWIGGRQRWKSFGTEVPEAVRRGRLWLESPEPEQGEEQQTLEVFGERWLREWAKLNRSPRAFANAEQRLRDHVRPVLGRMHLVDVQNPQLRALRADLEAKGLAPETVRGVLADAKCLLRYATECRDGDGKCLVDRAPSFRGIMPRQELAPPKRLSDQELTAVLKALPANWTWLAELSALTGLRWGELHRLQWRHYVRRPTPHLLLEQTKAGKPRRVPLAARAVEILEAQWQKTSSVFVVAQRGPFPPSGVVARAGKNAEVAWHWHQLRHTFACRYLEAGGNLKALQRILGHASIKTTSIYADLADGLVAADMERVGSGLTPKPLATELAG